MWDSMKQFAGDNKIINSPNVLKLSDSIADDAFDIAIAFNPTFHPGKSLLTVHYDLVIVTLYLTSLKSLYQSNSKQKSN